jgi:hypothetical protein
MDARSLEIIGACFTVPLLVGYSGGALEELSRGTRESFIKPTPWLYKSIRTRRYCNRFTVTCGSNIRSWIQPNGESPMCDSYEARLMELLEPRYQGNPTKARL